MATSLQKQLSQLKQQTVREADSRPSLLFSLQNAKHLDAESFYAIARNGLMELAQLNPAFTDFEDNLFHESSKSNMNQSFVRFLSFNRRIYS